MSDISKASRDAVEAAKQGEQFALLLAAVQAAQQAQQQQQPGQGQGLPVPVPRQAVARVSGGPAKWVALGVGGSFLALSLALSFIAVATGAVALTVCVVVLRGVWNDARKHH